MTNCQNEMKLRCPVRLLNMFRFDPRKKAEGKNPFTLDPRLLPRITKSSPRARLVQLPAARLPGACGRSMPEKAANASKDRYAYLNKPDETVRNPTTRNTCIFWRQASACRHFTEKPLIQLDERL